MDRVHAGKAKARLLGRLARIATRIHAVVYARSGGRLGAVHHGRPVMLLTTTGALSGAARSVPLVYMPDDGRFIVVPSNAGSDRAPAWWRNLEANPVAEARLGRRREAVAARVVDGPEREALWARAGRFNPSWHRYQQMTSRPFPLVALEPVDPRAVERGAKLR